MGESGEGSNSEARGILSIPRSQLQALSTETGVPPLAILLIDPDAPRGPVDEAFRETAAILGGSEDLVFAVSPADKDAALGTEPVLRVTTGQGSFVDIPGAQVATQRDFAEIVMSVALAATHRFAGASEALRGIALLRDADRVVVGAFASPSAASACPAWAELSLLYRGRVDLAELSNQTSEVLGAIGAPTSLPLVFSVGAGREKAEVFAGDVCGDKAGLEAFLRAQVPPADVKALDNMAFQQTALLGVPAVVLFTSPEGKGHEEQVQAVRRLFAEQGPRPDLARKFLYFSAPLDTVADFAALFGLSHAPSVVVTRDVLSFSKAEAGIDATPDAFASAVLALADAVAAGTAPVLKPAQPESSTEGQDTPADQGSADGATDAGDQGSAKGKAKSAAAPATQSGPVLVLTRDTFDGVAHDASRDVFVEFYSPQCVHCKKLAPFWEALGMAFARAPHLTIAKFDVLDNDLPEGITIPGVPTMMLFPRGQGGAAGRKEPVPFAGPRDLAHLIEFVKNNVRLDIPKEPVEEWGELAPSLQELVMTQRAVTVEALRKHRPLAPKEDL